MSRPWSRVDPAECVGSRTCSGALSDAYGTCADQASLLLSPASQLFELFDAVFAVVENLSLWQLCVLGYGIFSVLRLHSRWLLWFWLTGALLVTQAAYVFWQAVCIGLDVLFVSFLNVGARGWYVWTVGERWYRGGSIRLRVKLRCQLLQAVTWGAWSAAARELDELDGKEVSSQPFLSSYARVVISSTHAARPIFLHIIGAVSPIRQPVEEVGAYYINPCCATRDTRVLLLCSGVTARGSSLYLFSFRHPGMAPRRMRRVRALWGGACDATAA